MKPFYFEVSPKQIDQQFYYCFKKNHQFLCNSLLITIAKHIKRNQKKTLSYAWVRSHLHKATICKNVFFSFSAKKKSLSLFE